MDQHSDDFNHPPDFPALTQLIIFIEENVSHDQEYFSLAGKLKVDFESRYKQSLLLSAESPKAYPSFGIFSLSPEQLAEQLTFITAVSWQARGGKEERGGTEGRDVHWWDARLPSWGSFGAYCSAPDNIEG